jgi:putative two-component system response regulator
MVPDGPAAEDLDSLDVRHSTIMIVDDEPYNILVTQKYLTSVGYEAFVTTTKSAEVLALLTERPPGLVLLDIMMPEVSGLDILRAKRADSRLRHIPTLILTGATDARTKHEALALGATDFLTKPVDPIDLVPRVRNALLSKRYQDRLASYAADLERQVRARTAELEESRRQVVLCLARAAEFRDDDTGNHILRVGRYVHIIARGLGFSEDQAEMMELAAQLHDLGKIGIPDAILHKPGRLDPDERAIIEKHCAMGKHIIVSGGDDEAQVVRVHTRLGADLLNVPGAPLLLLAARIAQSHHERYDGTGYPLGLAGDDIPLEGRITAVADVYDALSSRRPYKPALPRERCFAILEEGRGTQFDPSVLDAFVARSEEIVETQLRFMDAD